MAGKIFRKWLQLAFITAAMCALVYFAAQQALRTNANDPQIQLAEDGAAALLAGSAPISLIPPGKVEISTSLDAFIMVYDSNGNPLASSATLHGADPVLPPGVLDSARSLGENRVTWQPEPGVRIAAVVVPAGQAGYVLAGRSLREVEKRVDQAGLLCGLALLGTWGASLVLVILLELFTQSRRAAALSAR